MRALVEIPIEDTRFVIEGFGKPDTEDVYFISITKGRVQVAELYVFGILVESL